MRIKSYLGILYVILLLASGCKQNNTSKKEASAAVTESDIVEDPQKIPIIFDTDANNELDDQHALAYLFFNTSVFDIIGITVNATPNGGVIAEQYKEAERVMLLCDVMDKYPLIAGANGNFEAILPTVANDHFDGKQAVDFIIEEARKKRDQPLVLMPVGKLTNIALALALAPDIAQHIKIVWLGGNYPEKGEYNLVADIPSMNYVLNQDVPFEMVTVRYTKPSGTDAVRVTPDEIQQKMPGLGPEVDPVVGRHGGEFTNFGDYSVNLFEHIDLHGDPPSRALFDMVTLAVLKNATWGETQEIPAPIMVNGEWKERLDNERKIIVWENFDKKPILDDFFSSMQDEQ